MIIFKLLICFSVFFFRSVVAEPLKVRLLAPPFVCPKDNDSLIEKPDYTFITLQTDPGLDVEFHWTVRWQPLVAPTQKFTLELWHTVRELEQKLNSMQIEPNVFIISNSELLSGVNYIFNVTATAKNEDSTEMVFHIDNIKGDPKLLIGGQSDMFSINLIGGQLAFADIDYTLEAQVTTCYTTHDYYFTWTVSSSKHNVAVSDVKGSQLVIPPNTLTPGVSYEVLCQVYKYSDGSFITQDSLPFRVLHRDLSVHFNVDFLSLSIETPFALYTDITKLDYLEEGVAFTWKCTFGAATVDVPYRTDDDGTLFFPAGLTEVGEYIISLTVTGVSESVADQAIVRLVTVAPNLPLIKLLPMSRLLNEDSVAVLKANVTNMMPGCSVRWYFKSAHCLVSEYSSSTDVCADNEHGTPISAPVNFYSLEENFLSELTDYTNETGWKMVVANLPAAVGRARVVAECTCENENCTSEGMVYADISFLINEKPPSMYVMGMPNFGSAMETIYRLSSVPVVNPNRPLRYTFYADLNVNETLLLGSHLEHQAIETLLPYIDKVGTFVWIEVCDSLGACSTGLPSIITVYAGEARTVDALLEDARAHVLRCEIMLLRRLTVAAVVTYKNAKQPEALTKFTTNLLSILGSIEDRCIERNYDQYNEFMYWLQNAGFDTSKYL